MNRTEQNKTGQDKNLALPLIVLFPLSLLAGCPPIEQVELDTVSVYIGENEPPPADAVSAGG